MTVLMGKLAEVELPADAWWRGYEAAHRFARRRPTGLGGQVVLALFELELGEPGAALVRLAAARVLIPPFGGSSDHLDELIALSAAEAHGRLRAWDAVADEVAKLQDPRFSFTRLQRDPDFWVDRDLAASLHPAVQARLDAWRQQGVSERGD